MITQQRFREEIAIFVERMRKENINWSLCENGEYAKETHLETLPDGRIVLADAHILYNSTYQVPTLWFNFFENKGSPIPFSTVIRDILKIPEDESEASIRTRISHFEHPFLGVLYFNIHPCNTSGLMGELKTTESYIFPWFSVYGPQVRLRVPML